MKRLRHETELIKIESEQIRIESELIKKESDQIKRETELIRKETEQLKRDNVRLKQLNARGRELLFSAEQLCSLPDTNSTPPRPTAPDLTPSWPFWHNKHASIARSLGLDRPKEPQELPSGGPLR